MLRHWILPHRQRLKPLLLPEAGAPVADEEAVAERAEIKAPRQGWIRTIRRWRIWLPPSLAAVVEAAAAVAAMPGRLIPLLP